MTSWKWSPYNAVSTGSKTGSSSVAASVTAVLDLPGVVEHVPCHPAQHIPRRPLSVLAPAEGFCDHGALLLPGSAGGDSCARVRCVAALGFDDVPSYVVAVAPTAARALAQRRRRVGHDRVQVAPNLRQLPELPLELGVVESLQVPLRRHRWSAEVGRSVAGDSADNGRFRRGEPFTQDGAVALGVHEQLFDGRFVTLGPATPPRPVQRTRERPLLPAFEVYPGHPDMVAGSSSQAT